MSDLLYTMIRDSVVGPGWDRTEGLQNLPEMPIYEISNIADYIRANGFEAMNRFGLSSDDKGDPRVEIDKIPNLFPPFRQFWMEAFIRPLNAIAPMHLGGRWETERNGDGWDLRMYCCYAITATRYIQAVPCYATISVDKEGSLLKWGLALDTQLDTETAQRARRLTQSAAVTSLVALSFLNMHKKSAQVVTNSPSRQVKRAAARKGKKPPPDFLTIKIRGMRYSRSGPGNKGEGGSYSLHIVRGHHMRVTQDNPLFGCDACRSGEGHGPNHQLGHVGTFWIEDYTTGDETVGDTTKVPRKLKIDPKSKP